MRPKKFRVWCEFEIEGQLHKCMEGPASWFLLTQTGHLMSHGPMSFDPNAEQKYKKAVPMFCIDLCDKHGTEIYKGDIVKRHNGEIGEVVFEEGCFIIVRTYTDTLEHIDWPTDYFFDCTIIGNIYENPELLGK